MEGPSARSPKEGFIGIFDSGVGGLTVMRAIAERLPEEPLIYLGDTARVPYGNRSAETVVRYALNATAHLVTRRIKALVVACNTASAHAIGALREAVDIPVLGVVEPVAARAAHLSATGEVAVLGTRATVASGCYPRALRQHRPELRVHQQACPLFVPLAEEGWLEGRVVDEVATHYLSALDSTGSDTVILGCTHYPILRRPIEAALGRVLGREVTVLDSAEATAEALAELLHERDIVAPLSPGAAASHRFLVTDDPASFMSTAARFFGTQVAHADHVDL